MFVTEFFHLSPQVKQGLAEKRVPWGFGPFSESIFYSRYSRMKPDGTQETWSDTVIRNIEGMFSILKTSAKLAGRHWDEKQWQLDAWQAAEMMFAMKWTPPGRGLWAQGTQFVYERGSDALNNCAFVKVTKLSRDAEWLMDKLMKGVGVGFDTYNLSQVFHRPRNSTSRRFCVPDSREGWTESVRILIESYETPNSRAIEFDYSSIRPAGEPIRGFGGTSGGHWPLEQLHQRLRGFLEDAAAGRITRTRLVADVMNSIGVCVIAGNVRRSAEIALGRPGDTEFLDLKDWKKYPERSDWMYLSNNSVVLDGSTDADVVASVVQRIVSNGEPGIINMPVIKQNGRVGEYKIDPAEGINPCGEVPLQSYETCNLSIIYPTRCTRAELSYATYYATLYSIAVSLLPSDNPLTEDVVSKNHRIGVGMSGLADWRDGVGRDYQLQELDRCYKLVEHTARKMAGFFDINVPVRLTTVKPDGTASLLAGVSPGMHWPWSGYVLRRVRQSASSPAAEMMMRAGVPWEPEKNDPQNTLVFEFPMMYNGGVTRSQKDVSLREQMQALADYQAVWADNSVSATLSFNEEEINGMVDTVAEYLPYIKAASFLPEDDGVYEQPPNTSITKIEYEARMAQIRDVDWAGASIGDGELDRYCDGDTCTI